jgi:hypothetical protein
MTLIELAKRNGHVLKACASCNEQTYSTAHAVAAVLNRWNRYERLVGPIDMDEATYLEAIEAAKGGAKFDGADYGALMEGGE